MRTIAKALVLALSILTSSLSLSAQTNDASMDDMVPKEDMRSPITKITPEQKHMYRITPLWENRLNTNFNSDANENCHNMFVIDNVIYIFVDYYEGDNAQKTILKRYDLSTGKMLAQLEKEDSEMKVLMGEWKPSGPFKNITITRDNFGHIVATHIRTASPDYGQQKLNGGLFIAVFDKEFNHLRSYECSEIFKLNLRFFSHICAPCIEGDALTGDFSISYSGWFANVMDESTSAATDSKKIVAKTYFPAIVSFNFEDSKCSEFHPIYLETAYNYDQWDPGNTRLAHYYFPAKAYITADTKDQIATCRLNDKKWLVQRRHEPLMLFVDKGSTIEINGENYPLLNQVEGTANPFKSTDATYNFNPAVVRLTDRYSLYSISSFENKNITFSAYDLPDENDLSSLTSLGEISGTSSFPIPSDLYAYDLYPFVTVVPVSDTPATAQIDKETKATIVDKQKANVVTYFPGSGLGSYLVEVSQSDEPTGLVNVVKEDAINFTLNGRNLTVDPNTDVASVELSVTSTTGMNLLTRKIVPGTTISLADLQPGVYCITLNSRSHMICLR